MMPIVGAMMSAAARRVVTAVSRLTYRLILARYLQFGYRFFLLTWRAAGLMPMMTTAPMKD